MENNLTESTQSIIQNYHDYNTFEEIYLGTWSTV